MLRNPILGLRASTAIYQCVTHFTGFNNGTPETTGIANTLFKPVNLSWNLAPNLSLSAAAGFYAPTGTRETPVKLTQADGNPKLYLPQQVTPYLSCCGLGEAIDELNPSRVFPGPDGQLNMLFQLVT